jgi:hypothetical protein
MAGRTGLEPSRHDNQSERRPVLQEGLSGSRLHLMVMLDDVMVVMVVLVVVVERMAVSD